MLVSVLIEPKSGYSEQELLQKLNDIGAEDIISLAPGFISAKLKRSDFNQIEKIADIHEKQVHTPTI